MKTIHPAVAEHVMEENEKLRGLLRDCLDLAAMPSITRRLIDAALSQQADPKCRTCSDVGVIGHSEVCPECADTWGKQAEPATAQDEREAHVPDKVFQDEFQVWWEDHGQFCRAGGGDYERTFAFQAWRHLYPMLMQARATRPAQTEQKPVGYQFQDREGVWKQFMSEKHYEDTLADGTWPIRAIYAAPIAQTDPQPEQSGLVMPVALASVSSEYDRGWSDHAAEVLRLNAALSAQGESHE